MKATDLKIGDWVEYFGPVQIAELNMFLWSGWAEDHNFITNIDYKDTKPIPLVKDILLKNGFREYSTDKYCNGTILLHYYHLGNSWEVFIPCPSETDNDNLAYISCIKYVHELQHILWVFKVEDSIKNLECTDIIFED